MSPARPPLPTKGDLVRAHTKRLTDLIAPDLKVLFVGINPGLYTAAIGFHYGRPGNRFWPAIYAGGFSQRLLKPWEEEELLSNGYGITNLVARPTLTAAELTRDELREGRKILIQKIERFRPRHVAILSISSYRVAFDQKDIHVGLQRQPLNGAHLWVLPCPSGLNAHFPPKKLNRLFAALRAASG